MKLKNSTVIVTGGAGNIGSHVVDVLVEQGNHVIVIDDFSVGSREKLRHHGSDVTIVEADIRDRERMLEVARDADVIFHLAVQCLRVSIKDPFLVHEVNVTGTVNMLQAAVQNRIGKFVYISSSEAYGSAVQVPMTEEHSLLPTTPYGASKAAGEHYVNAYRLTYGLDTQIVRPFNAYGPRFDVGGLYGTVIPRFLIRALNNRAPLIYGDGEQTRDYTYVRDTARGIVGVGETEVSAGAPINVSRSQPMTVREIAGIVLRVTGKSLVPEFYKPRPADVRAHWGDSRKAKELAGFEATTDIESGIALYMDWLLGEERRQPGYLRGLMDSIPVEAW